MKKTIVLLLLLLGLAAVAHGAGIRDFAGSWYDENGSQACVINPANGTMTDGGRVYRIKNIVQRVVQEGSLTKSRDFFILDDNGATVEKRIDTITDANGAIRFIIVPGYPAALQRTKTIEHSETVAGIYLGMLRAHAEAVVGRPDRTEKTPYGLENSRYSRYAYELVYEGNRVRQIYMRKGCLVHLDKSGLTSGAQLPAFERAYGAGKAKYADKGRPGIVEGYRIGENEFLYFFKDGSIILSDESFRS
ncbi:MAG: hypothetical protein LUF25_04945 [Phascolarctobacterium sp.]|nr:hypothetical protein [Phascolarctobacterium sp.]